MARRVELHTLAGTKRAGELARLVEGMYRQGRRIVVWVADEGRLQILDEYLWTFRRLAFLPHAVWRAPMADMIEPVALVDQPVNPNRAEILVVGDGLPPGGWAASFEEVHDLIPGGPEGDERRAFWDQWRDEHGVEGGEG